MRFVKDRRRCGYAIRNERGGPDIAFVVKTHPTWESNADLLAAAPELLAACKELEALFDNQGDARPYTWQERLPMLERARAAIAKAEGR